MQMITSRQNRLLRFLLPRREYTTIVTIAGYLNVSEKTIQRDLRLLEQWLGQWRINVEKRAGAGVMLSAENIADLLHLDHLLVAECEEIDGVMNNARRVKMALLINGIINHNEPQGVVYSRLDPGSYKALVHYFGEEEVLFVQSLLLDMENELSWSLGEPYYVNIFTHILIMMYRNTHGNALSREEDQTRQYDENIFNVASQMIHKIEQRIAHTLPDDEVWFIYQYIISSGVAIDGQKDVSIISHMQASNEARLITWRLITVFSDIVDCDFSEDSALYDGLLVHIKPLINRLNYRIHIRNPLLEDIKAELADVWRLTQYVVNQVFKTWGENAVSEDEVGYLTVHFQAAMERQIARKRVLLVCSTGIGTSHLLKSRILRAFPEWTIVDVISAANLSQVLPDNIELIISTINLPTVTMPVAYVTAFFNDADIKRVTEMVITEKLHHATSRVVEI